MVAKAVAALSRTERAAGEFQAIRIGENDA